ncbi:hypothetical protein CTI12_AA559830 [Artemisia annua]|uniref:Uncharacterized protein n=1 Tax=Artemisia annua TaxID=35608 RepID=A0A2U1KQU9_ARTAN|nr:hypothetical protein CTI12_AA559830 [Artemisia annua]
MIVMVRRDMTKVMWADQTAIRAGITKSAWWRMRLRAPATDDMLLYDIDACVLQRRKLISGDVLLFS